MELAQEYDVNVDMVYVIAAYHDMGLSHGREHHAQTSGELMLLDEMLPKWFNAAEICIMSEAVTDHRASIAHEPRSLYGKIVAEADWDIDYITILTRCVQYSVAHFSEYTYAQHFQRTFEHMVDKYGEQGYIKLFLDVGPNKRRLEKLRRMLASPERVALDFERIYYAVLAEQ